MVNIVHKCSKLQTKIERMFADKINTAHNLPGGQKQSMNLFRNFKFAQKISFLTASFFIFLAIIGYTAIRQISDVNSKVTELNNTRLAPIVQLDTLKSNIEYIRSTANSIMDAQNDDTAKKPIQQDLEKRMTAVNQQLQAYQNNPEFNTVFANYQNFESAMHTFFKNRGVGASQIAQSGPPTDMMNLDKTKKSVINAVDAIVKKEIANADQTYKDSQSVYKTTLAVVISLLVVGALITLLLSIVITKSIVTPVRNVTAKLRNISDSNGDLTQRISYNSKDEIGELSCSFDSFVDKLQTIVKEVANSAETIAHSSEELNQATGMSTQSLQGISRTVAEIASGTSQGAAVTEETTAKLEEIANFSESTANATSHTTENTRKVQKAAEEGAEKISEVVDSITGIASSSKDVSIIINELNQSSGKIGEIIQIITGISAQTNLLALNAAIEAARAGEAGKGFSVVAEEIRKLADESNRAALQISDLVKDNQVKSATAVNSVQLVEEKVADGVEKSSEVAESIQNIIQHIQSIVEEIEQVDLANEQQAISTKEMEQAIANLAATTNEMAAGTENISINIEDQLKTMTGIETTTHRLSEMAKRLREITGGFRV